MSTEVSRTGAPETIVQALGRWLSGLTLEDIPSEVVDHAKLCLLDGIGCGLYGSRQPWGIIAGDIAAELGGSTLVSLFGRAEKANPPEAALANGTAIHGFEIDDIHVASSFHPGAVVIPAALALAEARNVRAPDFLAALIGGYEIGIRLGVCAGVTHSTSGFHVTGTVGPVGAAAAAARCLGLNPLQTTHAIALGATQASGLYAARKAAMAKRFHAGRAAQSGVIAALFAEKGFTGALDAIEAPSGGFLATLHGQSAAETILEGLGDRWETARVGFKIYAACASAHTTIDAVDEMMRAGLQANNLDRLTIRMSRKGHINVGWKYVPAEIVTAQMNASYAAAVKLLDGYAFVDQYRAERLAEPQILELVKRIEILHDPELDLGGAAKRHAVTAEARLLDGRTLSARIEQRTGSAERPVSREQLIIKFRQLCASTLSDAGTSQLIDAVDSVDRSETIRDLIQQHR